MGGMSTILGGGGGLRDEHHKGEGWGGMSTIEGEG